MQVLRAKRREAPIKRSIPPKIFLNRKTGICGKINEPAIEPKIPSGSIKSSSRPGKNAAASTHDDAADGEEQVNTRALTDLDDVSSMDEIPEVDTDIPAGEFEKMAGEISSLESMREEEAEDGDDEDEDDM